MYTHNHAMDFLRGTRTDHQCRTVFNYMDLSGAEWEYNHDIVQWAFPTHVASAFNAESPVVVPGRVEHEYDLEALQERLLGLMQNYLRSINIEMNSGEFKLIGNEFEPPQHNMLRITRLITSLRLFGKEDLAKKLYFFMMTLARRFPRTINTTSVVFWRQAMYDQLN